MFTVTKTVTINAEEAEWYLGRVPEKNAAMYREEAEAKLKLQLAKLEPSPAAQVSTVKNPQETAVIVLSSNSPSTATIDFLNQHEIDLLVMGTVDRTSAGPQTI